MARGGKRVSIFYSPTKSILLIFHRAVADLAVEAVDVGEGEVASAGKTTESASKRSTNRTRNSRGTTMVSLECQTRSIWSFGLP